MSRVGRLVTARILSRIGLVAGILFGILLLVEFLDTGRFIRTAELGGVWSSIAVALLSALRWSLLALPVTVLIGAIVGLVDLHTHREMVIVNASGRSVWTVLQWPIAAILLIGLVTTTLVDSFAIRAYQAVDAAEIGWGRAYGVQNRAAWFNQTGADGGYRLHAETVTHGGAELFDVTAFRMDLSAAPARFHAARATLEDGYWRFEDGVTLTVDAPPVRFETARLATDGTLAELSLQLGTTEDLSFFALRESLATGIADPIARAAAQTRYQKLLAMPVVLAGSLLIAFAFTAGYRRGGHYGWTVVYGIVLGLVVFVVTEMADRAGSAGVLDPVAAAWGPALAAIVIGLSVLLRKEDGRV